LTTFVLPSNYESIIFLVLTFADGLLIGVAIKKGIMSFILAIIGAFLAAYIGISLPGVSVTLLLSRFSSFALYLLSRAPGVAAGLPILFLLGLAIGLWKG